MINTLMPTPEDFSKYPKVLFIQDEIPQTINAGSIQFFRLFKEWPPEKLLVIGRPPDQKASLLSCKYHTLQFPVLDRIRLSRLHTLLPNLETVGLMNYKLPETLRKIADDFNPDVVISIMQLYMYYKTAYNYTRKRKIPLIIFCHDDVEEFSGVSSLLYKQLIKRNARIYQHAQKRICISPEMAELWQKKYDTPGDYLYPIPSENIDSRSIEQNQELKTNGKLTVGFAGSLAYGYREGILEILPFIKNLNIILRIYRDGDEKIIENDNLKFCGYAKTPEEAWKRIISECDAVILPYSFNHKYTKLYSSHFPSKLTEYCKLGMPLILRGPEYATGIKWAKKNNLETCSLSHGKNFIEHVELLKKADNRKIWAKNAIRAGKNNFDPENSRKKLYDMLLTFKRNKN